jgi:predicted subunit of tRNA(5-methylaminomethyl-2-thiouridylate) methyltransferase
MANSEMIQKLETDGLSSVSDMEFITNALEENTKLKAEIEGHRKETSQDKIDYAYDLGYQSCLNHNGVGWVDAEEIQKLRKEIEQLKSELERSVRLPLTNADKIRSMNDKELAEYICGIIDIGKDKFINGITIPNYDENSIYEWLQSEVENGN